MDFRARAIFLFFLVVCLAAGLGVLFSIGFAMRLGSARGPTPADLALTIGLTVVFNLGAAILVAHLARKDAEYQLLDMGKSAWLWMIALCYVAGLATGVVILA
jgi:hypothetical protein